MRSLFKGKKQRGRRRMRRILKVFTVGAGLGAAAGLLSPPKRAKRNETPGNRVGDKSLKPSETPAEVIETEAALDPPARRSAAAPRAKRSVSAKVSEKKPADRGTSKPKPKAKPRQKPGQDSLE